MPPFSPEDALRIARLARVGLSVEEAARLAPTLEAIARDFGSLAEYAASLPPAPEPAPGALREDVVVEAAPETVEAILRAAPRVDAGLVRAPRGAP